MISFIVSNFQENIHKQLNLLNTVQVWKGKLIKEVKILRNNQIQMLKMKNTVSQIFKSPNLKTYNTADEE